ncbi:hypothetical protein [Gordonia sp. (in: high G+C Gram-positive bacteria)]|uniref:hypothetical protein n=1 Tax=Gordonia sp. (in: high G+C Gram-positive bacteria) TaxID=84139 RepID=UPI0033409110
MNGKTNQLRRARLAQRQLDYARADRRIAAWAAVGCTLLIAAVITGWWATIQFGAAGYEQHINRTGVAFAFVVGLTIASTLVIILTGFVLGTLFDQNKKVRESDDRYQDILDQIGHDQ